MALNGGVSLASVTGLPLYSKVTGAFNGSVIVTVIVVAAAAPLAAPAPSMTTL